MQVYTEKKGTSKDNILTEERQRVDDFKKQFEKRGGNVPDTLTVNSNRWYNYKKRGCCKF